VVILGVSSAIICKERFQESDDTSVAVTGMLEHGKAFFKGFAITIKNAEFFKLCVGTFFLFNSLMLVGSFGAFITIYYVAVGDSDMGAKLIGVVGSISTIVTLCTIPVVSWVSTKIGKRKTFMIATSFTLFGSLLKWFCYDPTNPWLLLVPAPFIAVGMGSLFTLMSSMMADVCDADELATGERREGMYGSIFWWVVKLGMAGAFAGSGFLLNATGFEVALNAAQSADTFLYMRLCDVFIPATACLISIIAVAKFSITEASAYDIRSQLEVRRGKIGIEATATA